MQTGWITGLTKRTPTQKLYVYYARAQTNKQTNKQTHTHTHTVTYVPIKIQLKTAPNRYDPSKELLI